MTIWRPVRNARRAARGGMGGCLVALALALGAAPGALGAGAAPAPDRICLDDAPVCLEIRESGALINFVVSNATLAPYTVRISASELDNLKPVAPLPFRGVVEPGDEVLLGTLAPVDRQAETHYLFAWRAALGSMLARHDDRWLYRAPFGGDAYRAVSQGSGERAGHSGAARHALDFSMPFGTPVLAARAGTVVNVVDDDGRSRLRGVFHDRTNRVEVLHADGTIVTYANLRHGAPVAPGDRVETGDPIGSAGDAGFGTNPHLHFMVWRRAADLEMATLPVRFYDGTPEGAAPAIGTLLAPGCATSGEGCSEGQPPPPSEAAAAPAPARARSARSTDGGCHCPNGAVIYVDLPCSQVCGH